MKWIGLTGGMGCGKSTVLGFFKTQGLGVASADQVVSDLYKSPEVISHVCTLIGLSPEEFSKEKVAQVVFKNKDKLRELESYLHPLVRTEVSKIKKNFEDQNKKIAFYEVPLLFEKNMETFFEKTLCVGASRAVQKERILKRNSWSEEEIEARLSAQMPLEQKKERADFYIDNSGSFEELKVKCLKILKELLSA